VDLNIKFYKIFKDTKTEKGHNSVKMATRVMQLCLYSPITIVSEFSKSESNSYDTLEK
jgi:hypothetical protein